MGPQHLTRRLLLGIAVSVFFITTALAGELHDWNSYDISIPDNCTGVSSDLLLNWAESGAKITDVDLYAEIYHPRHSDLILLPI
jgi:hypothetical protein